jgi:hypothetical protein
VSSATKSLGLSGRMVMSDDPRRSDDQVEAAPLVDERDHAVRYDCTRSLIVADP